MFDGFIQNKRALIENIIKVSFSFRIVSLLQSIRMWLKWARRLPNIENYPIEVSTLEFVK